MFSALTWLIFTSAPPRSTIVSTRRFSAAAPTTSRQCKQIVFYFAAFYRPYSKISRLSPFLSEQRLISRFCRFTSGFKETVDQAARLTDVDPETFDLFLEWIYRGSFRTIDMTKSKPTTGPIVDRIKLYAWAEEMCSPELMNYTATSIISALKSVRKYDDNLSHEGSRMIYDLTSAKAPLRRFAVMGMHYGMVSYENDGCWTTASILEAIKGCTDLEQDLMNLLRHTFTKSPPQDPTKLPACTFHVHEKDKTCKFDVLSIIQTV
jgi:hypothetical protein